MRCQVPDDEPTDDINPAIYYVIPRKGQGEIQESPRYDWIPAFAGMTGL